MNNISNNGYENREIKQHKVGTIMSMVDLIKEIFKKRKKGERKPIKREDKMATNSIKLLTGNSHPQLAKLVADRWVIFISYLRSWGMGGCFGGIG